MSIEQGIGQILFSREDIDKKISQMGQIISRDYAGKQVLLVGVLKGSFLFLADLARALSIDVQVDFLAVSSYGGATSSSGTVRILKDLDHSIEGRHVLLVEDIVDTGLTLNYLTRLLGERRPASLKVCSLLDKPSSRKIAVDIDYLGFTVPQRFVIGYGLDVQERYRQLPYIALWCDESEH